MRGRKQHIKRGFCETKALRLRERKLPILASMPEDNKKGVGI